MTGQQNTRSRRGAPIGRPRGTSGPQRVPFSVRLLTSTDQRLAQAITQTGRRPQELAEEALNDLFDKLGIAKAES